MIQKKLLFTFLGLIAAFVISSCGSKFSGYQETDTGLYYKFHIQEDSESPKLGDVVTLNMVYGVEDSVLFNSSEVPRAFQLVLQESQYGGDIYECLSMLSLGDSASFMVKADSFFYITAGAPSLPSYVDSTSYMDFHIALKKFQTQDEAKADQEAELKILQEKEAGIIEKYVNDNNISVKPDDEGLYFIRSKKTNGQKVKEGKIILINYTLKFTNGETLFTTFTKGELIDFEYGTRFDTKGFTKGIGMMRKGEKATFIVPSSLGFGATGAGQSVGPYTPLIYEIEVVDIKDKTAWQKEKNAKAELANKALADAEKDAIKKYLTDNKLNVKPTDNGLYFIEKSEGEGEIPISGDKVKVHYTLTTLNNDTIDSSVTRGEALDFTVDQQGIIQGWHEGIKLMREGGKAFWLIPSKLGYGPTGRPPMIQPFTPLLFEIEFVKIVK